MTEISFSGAKTTGQRFASVWDALPPGLRDADKSTREPLANAGNATGAIYWAASIASINWTDKTENATSAGCMESVRQSNE